MRHIGCHKYLYGVEPELEEHAGMISDNAMNHSLGTVVICSNRHVRGAPGSLNVMLEKQAGLAYDRLMEEVSALIDALKSNLRSFPHVRLAVAFGSRARGDAHPTSDLDIAVELTPGSSLLDIGALVDRITTLTALKVDIVELSGLPESDPLMAYNIAKDGIPLIEKTPGSFLEFRNLACIAYFDVQAFLAEQNRKLTERLQENTFGRPRYA